MTPVLHTEKLCKSFGALTVAHDIDFRLQAGDRHALIGPNGAGKTTFVNMLMGVIRPSSGRIVLAGEDVTRASQAARVKRGLGRTFQITTLFRSLPVLDNVALAVAERRGTAHGMWRPARSYKNIIQESEELLSTLGIEDDALARVADLPYGKQRLVEIAIALGLKPKVLLLDEPAAGLNDSETQRLAELLVSIAATGLTIVIVEHNMSLVMSIAQNIVVLDAGRVIAQGTPAEVQSNDRVIEAYVGREDDAVTAGR